MQRKITITIKDIDQKLLKDVADTLVRHNSCVKENKKSKQKEQKSVLLSRKLIK